MNEFFINRPELFWFILGLVLLLLELVVPGFVIIFFGVGAWITSLVCIIFNPGINFQAAIFAVTSVIVLLVFRRMIQNKFIYNKDDKSESIEDEFTGREAVAIDDFGPDKTGKVEFKGTTWNAESESVIKSGQRVIIIEKVNVKLIVKPK
ncbi:MAG TPA: hypothetical protein DDW27_04910 [Bacteroidales bacterium]|nr:hypothetical protein [Bacteroidales bacterium]